MALWKHYKRMKRFTFILSVMLTYIPLITMIVCGFALGKETNEKVILATCCLMALILGIVESKTHKSVKGVFSLVLLGCYLTVDKISAYLLAIMICSVFDDIIMYPLYYHYKKEFEKIDQAKAVKDYEQSREFESRIVKD